MSNGDDLAFPYTEVDYGNEVQGVHEGLTKREHFAGLAMQGWLARCANAPHLIKIEPEAVASVAVEMADALISELSK